MSTKVRAETEPAARKGGRFVRIVTKQDASAGKKRN